MACGSDYGIISEIYLNSGTDDWKHVYSDNEEDICKDSMVDGWYGKTFENNGWTDDDDWIDPGSLRDTNFVCVDDIDCVAKNGRQSTIYAPATGNLSLECDTRDSCNGITVIGPTNGDLHIVCDGRTACQSSTITGPT
eukprot:528340_1